VLGLRDEWGPRAVLHVQAAMLPSVKDVQLGWA
jgi:hypothetical protein